MRVELLKSDGFAKLIDFSKGGFKIEFLENFQLKNMENIVLHIPLELFQIEHKKKIKLHAKIKWYDPLHKQVGGTYTMPSKQDDEILEKIIVSLAGITKTEQK